MRSPKAKYSVVFLPWIKLDKEYSFTNVKLIPWPKYISKYIRDKVLLEQIDKIFSSYKLNILDNKKNVTIASISSEILSSENADRLNEIYNAVKVFAFCCIAKNQYFESHKNYVNASCFELVSQRFVYDNNMVSLYSYKRDGSTLDGGYKYEDLNILAPV